jgi:hypothetical protein
MSTDNPAARVDLDAHWSEAEREALADAFGEWLHRMHGVVSSCDHKAEADGIAEAMAPILADRLAPLLAERDDALTRADTWREEFDKAEALTTRWRVRAETAEAERDEARAALEAGDACGAVGCRALAERDALRERVEAARQHGAQLHLTAQQLREQGDVRQVLLGDDGVDEAPTLADELWLIAYNLRAALADPEAS